jgi:hypothetical protein
MGAARMFNLKRIPVPGTETKEQRADIKEQRKNKRLLLCSLLIALL